MLVAVQGYVSRAALERAWSRLQQIEASQDEMPVKQGRASGQIAVLEAALVADLVKMFPDEYRQQVEECYAIYHRLLRG